MKAALLLVVGIFLLNTVAHFLYWYTAIPWFDMLMHTLGGIFLAVGVTGLIFHRFLSEEDLTTFFLLLAIVFVIGLGWEGYEYLVQYFIKGVHLAGFKDSLSDLYFDVTGAAIAAIFVLWDKRRYNRVNDR